MITQYPIADRSPRTAKDFLNRLQTHRYFPLLFAGFITVFPLCLIWFVGHLPAHQARARRLVETTYSVELQPGNGNDSYPWDDLRQRYGKVIRFDIRRERFTMLPRDFVFEVSVQRENATTVEIVNVYSGNNANGDYAHIGTVNIESSVPGVRANYSSNTHR